MPNEIRLRQNFLGGLIEDNPLSATATVLTSGSLANMQAVDSNSHIALVLDPDGVYGAPEIVWVTSHAIAANTATVLRGQENTTARPHARDTPWVHGPTAVDASRVTRITDVTAESVTITSNDGLAFATTTVTFIPAASGFCFISASARVTSSGGNEGAYLYPSLTYTTLDGTLNGGLANETNSVAEVPLLSVQNTQVVRNPLSNELIVGSALYAVTPNYRYSLRYAARKGRGGTNATFSDFRSTLTINHLGA